MAVRGTDHYENLTAAGSDRAAAPVRFGDYAVPAAVAWIRRPLGRDPEVRAEFEMRKGVPVCTSISVQAQPNGRPVTTGDLDTLPGLDKKASEAFRALAVQVPDEQTWRSDAENPVAGTAALLHPPARKVQKALGGRSDEVLQRVAEIYRTNFADKPALAVADELGLDQRTANRRIREARDRGFLPDTTRGRKKA